LVTPRGDPEEIMVTDSNSASGDGSALLKRTPNPAAIQKPSAAVLTPARERHVRAAAASRRSHAGIRAALLAVALALSMEFTRDANAHSSLPDPVTAGVADRLYRLDCGHSLANDESVWTPGENVGRSIEFSSTCWLIRHKSDWLLWDTGVPEATLKDPRGWSTLPKLIVYHLDRSVTGQLADIGLKPGDIGRVAISHTHGDHIGNVMLFPDSTILMQRAEYRWIYSPDGTNDNVNQLMALARKLLGTPKKLQLIDGDTDIYGDGSVTLLATPGHTPGHQSLLVHLRTSGFIILSGDVVHLEENFQKNIVPTLNTDKAESVASMEKVRRLIAQYKATMFINHDKSQTDKLKLLPAFYD
jgi:N-acyl homoserine lactone hydrolase